MFWKYWPIYHEILIFTYSKFYLFLLLLDCKMLLQTSITVFVLIVSFMIDLYWPLPYVRCKSIHCLYFVKLSLTSTIHTTSCKIPRIDLSDWGLSCNINGENKWCHQPLTYYMYHSVLTRSTNIAKGKTGPKHWVLWLIQHFKFKAEASTSFEILVKHQLGFVLQRMRNA